jgi:hypothetical protein
VPHSLSESVLSAGTAQARRLKQIRLLFGTLDGRPLGAKAAKKKGRKDFETAPAPAPAPAPVCQTPYAPKHFGESSV